MSFDVRFLDLAPGESFEDVVSRSEEEESAGERDLTAADVERWDAVTTALRPLLPGAEEFADASHRELNHLATALQVSVFAGELSLSVPYWHSGPEAREVVDRLGVVVRAIEAATGLTAYDPQADAAFVGVGENTAAAAFDQAAVVLSQVVETSPEVGGSSRSPRRGLFRRRR